MARYFVSILFSITGTGAVVVGCCVGGVGTGAVVAECCVGGVGIRVRAVGIGVVVVGFCRM